MAVRYTETETERKRERERGRKRERENLPAYAFVKEFSTLCLLLCQRRRQSLFLGCQYLFLYEHFIASGISKLSLAINSFILSQLVIYALT